MLLRRYGQALQSVVIDFDSNAINEIGFRRDRKLSVPLATLESEYEKVREESVVSEAEGPVQNEAEALLLERLREKIEALLAGLAVRELLVIESEQGVDYPKARDRKEGVIVEGENRLYFHWRVEPPLRVGIYRPRGP
jgi:hypothetical protein